VAAGWPNEKLVDDVVAGADGRNRPPNDGVVDWVADGKLNVVGWVACAVAPNIIVSEKEELKNARF